MPQTVGSGGGGMNIITIAKTGGPLSASQAILILGVELVGVGLLTLLAGISNDVGNIIVLLMIGFWLIYLIVDSTVIGGIGNMLDNIAKQASA